MAWTPPDGFVCCRSLRWLWALLVAGGLYGQVIHYQDTVTFTPLQPLGTLSSAPVIEGSWVLTDEAGTPVDTGTLRLDPVTGVLQWVGDMEGKRRLIVRYRALTGLSTTVVGPAWRYLPPLEEVAADSASLVTDQRASREVPVPSNPADGSLVTAGTLFRGLTLTSGHGVNLTGGLNLRLQGELGRGVFIHGSLTDQNLPIQPEGNTRSLNELDQVRLALTGNWGEVEAGDFILRGAGGRLASFERKLEGMRMRLRGEGWQVEGALAGSQGRFRSQQIQGEDGRQGPYLLITHEGSRTLIVLAGTEKVWLNGRLLQRGEGLDYTIDYNTGEISFTPRHPIRSDSRIVVDFEYTDLVYSRTTGYLSAGWQGKRSGLSVSAFTERDLLQSNLEFSLSAADRKLLEGIGDREQEAIIATAVADSAGNYDLANGRYEWRGAGAGTYAVSFFNAGAGGEYRRLVAGDSIIYRWVPPDDRSRYQVLYAPYRRLKLPHQQDVMTAGWFWKGRSEGTLAQVEAGLSQVDLNRYSPQDDDDNLDGGYTARLRWSSPPLALAGRSLKAGVQLEGQGKGSRFQPPGRWDAVEFQRDWDLDGPVGAYHWQTGEVFLEQGGRRRIFTQLGRIQADSIQTGRLRWGLTGGETAPLTGRFIQTVLARGDSARSWRITDGEVAYQFKQLKPFLRYYGEDRKREASSGYHVEQVTYGVQAEFSPRTRATLSRERRRDVFQSGLTETARLWLLSLSRSTARGTRLETTFSFNEKATSDSRDNLAYLMGDLSFIHRPASRAWWLDLRHRLERTVAETKAVVYDSVGTGLGQYRYDPAYDAYVSDEAGPYVRYLIPTGEVRPVHQIKSRFRLQMDLNRLRGSVGLFKDFTHARLIMQGRLAAKTAQHSMAIYLRPALEDTSAVQVNSRLQLDLSLQSTPRTPQYKLRLFTLTRLGREDMRGSAAASLLGEGLEQATAELVRVSRHDLAGRQVNLDVRVVHERKETRSMASPLRNHAILKWQGRGAMSGSLWKGLTASLTGEWRQEVDHELDDLQVQTILYGAGLQQAVGSRGRLRVDLERFQVSADRDIPIPYLLAEGFPTGISQRLRASGQFQLSSNLLLTVTLFSRQEAGRSPFSNANLELRTQF